MARFSPEKVNNNDSNLEFLKVFFRWSWGNYLRKVKEAGSPTTISFTNQHFFIVRVHYDPKGTAIFSNGGNNFQLNDIWQRVTKTQFAWRTLIPSPNKETLTPGSIDHLHSLKQTARPLIGRAPKGNDRILTIQFSGVTSLLLLGRVSQNGTSSSKTTLSRCVGSEKFTSGRVEVATNIWRFAHSRFGILLFLVCWSLSCFMLSKTWFIHSRGKTHPKHLGHPPYGG